MGKLRHRESSEAPHSPKKLQLESQPGVYEAPLPGPQFPLHTERARSKATADNLGLQFQRPSPSPVDPLPISVPRVRDLGQCFTLSGGLRGGSVTATLEKETDPERFTQRVNDGTQIGAGGQGEPRAHSTSPHSVSGLHP